MSEHPLQREDYPLDKQGLTKLLCVITDAVGELEADTWDRKKIREFAELITSCAAYWQQATDVIWQLRHKNDAKDAPQDWSNNIRDLYELTRSYRTCEKIDLSLPKSSMREAQRLNLRMLEERAQGFFRGIAPFPEERRTELIKVLAQVIQSLDPSFQPISINETNLVREGSGPLPEERNKEKKQTEENQKIPSSLPMHSGANPTPKGIITETGLRNRKNSCYQNGILQALRKNKRLIRRLELGLDAMSDKKQRNFAELLIALSQDQTDTAEARLQQFWNDVDTVAMHDECWKAFASLKQQDAADFLEQLIGTFCPALAVVFPVMHLKVTYKCLSCKIEESTEVPERMRLVNVRIPNPPNNLNLDLEDMMSFGQWIAVAQGDNFKGVCTENSEQVQQMRCTSAPDQWPDDLIIQLERFEWVIDAEVWKKQEMVKYSMNEVTMPGGVKYVIRTVVCHVGDTSNAGHYYAMSFRTEDSQWYRFDDERMTKIDDNTELVSKDAYLIFLEKKGNGDVETSKARQAIEDVTRKEKEAYARKDAELKAQARREEQEPREREALAATAADIKAKTEAMRRNVIEEERQKARLEKAKLEAATADPDKAEADAKAEVRTMSENELKAVRSARAAIHGAPDTASGAEIDNDGGGHDRYEDGRHRTVSNVMGGGVAAASGDRARTVFQRNIARNLRAPILTPLEDRRPLSQRPDPDSLAMRSPSWRTSEAHGEPHAAWTVRTLGASSGSSATPVRFGSLPTRGTGNLASAYHVTTLDIPNRASTLRDVVAGAHTSHGASGGASAPLDAPTDTESVSRSTTSDTN